MATYNLSYEPMVGGDPDQFTETFTLNDHTIYGASRLGIKEHNEVLNIRNIEVVSYTGKAFNVVTELNNTPATEEELGFNYREVGKKSYELANHLGNVLAVITDQKIAVDDHQYVSGAGNYDKYTENGTDYYYEVAHGTGAYTINSISGDGIVDYYLPNVIMFSDYYPYGMQLDNRFGSDNTRKKYRYGFNGMEKDDEVKGSGNSYTTEFRQYDSRLGRWLSLDPLAAKFPWQSPYVAFNNNPIYFIDPNGLEGVNESSNSLREDVPWYDDKYIKKRKESTMRGMSLEDFNKKYRNRLWFKLHKFYHSSEKTTPMLGNIGKGGPNGGQTDHKIIFDDVDDVGDFYHTWGYSVAVINPAGKIEVQHIGKPGRNFGAESLDPFWVEGNPYGQKAGTPILTDENKNIIDESGTILIPYLKGLEGGEAFYGPGEISDREIKVIEGNIKAGMIVKSTRTIRENLTTGEITDLKTTHSDVTEKIEEINK